MKGLAQLYDTWHEAEPGAGYDAQAAEWRAKVEQAERTAEGDPQPELGATDDG